MENQITQDPIPVSPPSNKSLVILLSILLLVLAGSTSFLAYQNIQLQKQIVSLQAAPSATPTASADPTANWKTYINNASDYTLKYPPTLNVIESNQLLGNGEISDTKWNLSTTNDVPNIRMVVYKSDSNFAKSITPGGTQAVVAGKTATKNTTEGKTFTTSYLVTNATNTYFIDLEVASKQESSQYEPLFDQILSTFTFLGQTANASSEIKRVVTNYLKNNGHDLSKVTVSEPQKLGTLTDVYTVSWTETGYVGGGRYVLVGKKDNQWIIPNSGDSTYCGWIKTAGLDAATQAFMGPTCK